MSHHYHEHDHLHDTETYYLDQLCLVALSGAFGAVCLSLFFWQQKMLELMLGKQFHNFVLFSGIALVALTVIRAVALWVAVGNTRGTASEIGARGQGSGVRKTPFPSPALQEHEPGHVQHHHHDQAGCPGHDRDSHQEPGPSCCHEQDHGHHHHDLAAHQQGHGQAHDHAPGHCQDHDHAWAPWRYVVLLVPIILFLLGLPNKGPKVRANGNMDVSKEIIKEALGVATVVVGEPASWHQLALAAAFVAEPASGPALNIDFKTLEKAAYDPEQRQRWQGQTVRVRGQFAPHPSSDRVFSLARFSIQCCRADAIQLNVTIVSRESLAGIVANQWVEVTGKVEFRERNGSFFTLMIIPGKKVLKLTDPDTNPYV